MKSRIACCVLLFLVCIQTPWAEEAYTVSVVPFLPPGAINKQWAPFLTYLSQASGVQLQLKVYEQFAQFEDDFLSGTPDFAFLNPYHAVMAYQAQHYEPLVRDSSELLSVILVVRAAGDIAKLEDLAGRRIAFSSPNAFASLYLRAVLKEREHIDIHPVFVTSPQNALRHVITGDAAAGSIILPLLKKEPVGIRKQLDILYTSPAVAPHPLSAHPRVPEAVREAVRKAILGAEKDEVGRKLLRDVMLTRPVAADYGRDYGSLSALHLDRFVVKSQTQ